MEEKNQNIDSFEKYLADELSQKEVLEFDARLAYDSEFRNEFEQYQAIEQGIKTHYRNKLKSKFENIDSALDQKRIKQQKIKKQLLFSTSFAALLIIGCVILLRLQTSSSTEIAQKYWTEEPGLPVKMGTKGKYDDAMNAYKLGELDKASILLKNIQSDTSYYFQGIVAYEMDNTFDAKRYLKRIQESSVYYQKAQFRLGLVLISEGDLKTSKKIFEELVAGNSTLKDVSEEILMEIK